jgi:8-oxo-dGTP pyrophosphatase MutT (NUDIX family)
MTIRALPSSWTDTPTSRKRLPPILHARATARWTPHAPYRPSGLPLVQIVAQCIRACSPEGCALLHAELHRNNTLSPIHLAHALEDCARYGNHEAQRVLMSRTAPYMGTCASQCCSIHIEKPSPPPRGYFGAWSRASGTGGIVLWARSTNSFLVVQCYGNKWGFPKGAAHAGETVREAALRELREETGVALEADALDTQPLAQRGKRRVYYFAAVAHPIPAWVQQPQPEANAVGWVRVRCAGALAFNNACARVYKSALARARMHEDTDDALENGAS